MVTRTLKLNEIVYAILEQGTYVVKGRITAVDNKQRDFTCSENQDDIDVEVEITELKDAPDYKVGEHVHVQNKNVYQIVPNKHYLGEEVCYELEPEKYDAPYYCCILGDEVDEDMLDENQPHVPEEKYMNGHEYVNAQIESGRWILDSDTFDIETALADAWREGYAQGHDDTLLAS